MTFVPLRRRTLEERRDRIDEALTYLSDPAKNYDVAYICEALSSTRILTLGLINELLLEREELRDTIVKIAHEGLPE